MRHWRRSSRVACSTKASTRSASSSPSCPRARRASAPRSPPPTPASTSTAPSTPSPASAATSRSFRKSQTQVLYFIGRKVAPGAFGEVAEGDGADGGADEAEDGDVERGQEAADLAIAAFVEDDLQPGVLRARAQQARRFCTQ